MVWLSWIGAFGGIIFAIIVASKVMKKDEGTDVMKEISQHIREGANAYLKRQYIIVAIFFAVVFVLLFIKSIVLKESLLIPVSFLSGGLFSGLAGYFGMKMATNANNRTAWAAKSSLNEGLRVAFNSGTVMGMLVVGLGLLHLSIWYFVLGAPSESDKDNMLVITNILVASGLGASSMALFARVGGGIFTKAADVGADLVGKVEAGIPEDDPRNPATIADNVGDNVGDVAGMGADLYESYIGSIVATMAIAAVAFAGKSEYLLYVASPLILAAIGVICSIIGTFFVRTGSSFEMKNLLWALRKGIYISSGLVIVLAFIFIKFGFVEPIGLWGVGIFIAVIIGLIAGNVIGYFTDYFTSYEYKPTKILSEQSKTGPATIIIGGLALGMNSTVIPVITIILAIMGAYFFAGGGESVSYGLFGIGMAAVGMLSTLGITLATDAYGPVADNAGGVAEMSKLPPEVRERTDALDALGNTTAATGKGFAIGSAALTALTLLVAYVQQLKPDLEMLFKEKGLIGKEIETALAKALDFDITEPIVLVGLFIGAMLPFFFSAMTMSAVGRAAGKMVEEVRRQFREKPGIMTGKEKPDYASCVSISTTGAQKEMIKPALLAILAPIVVGIVFGVQTVVALLAGSLVSGFVLAIMMANAGGAWDNAKKYIEQGALGGKGSDAHKAAVVGDTVGDPFKDTSGPSINILLKLMGMVAIATSSAVVAIRYGFFG